MINNKITSAFNEFTNSINNIQSIHNKIANFDRTTLSCLERIRNSIVFMTTNDSKFNVQLGPLINELNEIEKDVKKVKDALKFTPDAYAAYNNLKKVISLVTEEQKTRTKIYESALLNTKKIVFSKGREKVKIFKSSFADDVEREMNKFFEENDVEVIRTLQDIKVDAVCITVFYKYK